MVVHRTSKGVESMKIHRIDHVGVTVNDLPAAKAFFSLILDWKCKGKENWKESDWIGLLGLITLKQHITK